MSKTEFHGREAELKLLEKLWRSSKAALLILYGRRRVGKTRLLTHWIERHADRAIYWVAEPTSALDQLRSFSQALYNFKNPEAPAPLDFTYANWEQALQQAGALAKHERLALMIDEFTYLLEVDPTIVGIMQKAWDHWLSKSNLILALSGSQMGLMQKQVLSYQAPLYGRATAQMQLLPLSFDVTARFFPHYTIQDRVAIYAIFGGIPAYWERIDGSASVMENVRMQLLTPNTLMQEEPRLLLQDFINDQHNYVGIMRAITQGARTQNAISSRTGLPQGHVSKYLSVLRDTGFVERQVPITENESSRRGRYFVTDPYLRFYYRFLATHQAQLAMGVQQQTLTTIEQNMPAFIEENTWRELCSEWVLRASAYGKIPVTVEKVGGDWKRTQAFDVVGINEATQNLVLGNCLWRDSAADAGVMRDLVTRTSAIVPKKGEWSVLYLGFASGGWSEEAADLAEQLATTEAPGKNWHVAGVKLLDLKQVDTDLAHWSNGVH
ncbi:MAG: ATP-binding protein [Chloroflexi bacterium]|nr:ATP-binding protein [Chloroflexota bacterium]MCI0579868.1 ATP-binding protein [Chloroflexota bacterium]MCI0646149.1 ATP-binding protein [Chloroflexota bacterium]MCI0729859.1 ATP-binding protein [Chloroflexota bacterium]